MGIVPDTTALPAHLPADYSHASASLQAEDTYSILYWEVVLLHSYAGVYVDQFWGMDIHTICIIVRTPLVS